eukprot:gene18869-23111_t
MAPPALPASALLKTVPIALLASVLPKTAPTAPRASASPDQAVAQLATRPRNHARGLSDVPSP